MVAYSKETGTSQFNFNTIMANPNMFLLSVHVLPTGFNMTFKIKNRVATVTA